MRGDRKRGVLALAAFAAGALFAFGCSSDGQDESPVPAFCKKQCEAWASIDCCFDGKTSSGEFCVESSQSMQECLDACTKDMNDDRVDCKSQLDEYAKCGATATWSCGSAGYAVTKECSTVPIICCHDPSFSLCP